MACYALGNIFVRECPGLMAAGDSAEGHEHNFDHVTYCPSGALRIEQFDAEDGVLKAVEIDSREARNFALIKAGVRHRLTALRDGTRYHCIYSHRDPAQPDVIVHEWNGWEEASQ